MSRLGLKLDISVSLLTTSRGPPVCLVIFNVLARANEAGRQTGEGRRNFLLHLPVTHAAPHVLPSGVAGAEGEVRPACLIWSLWTTGLVAMPLAIVRCIIVEGVYSLEVLTRAPNTFALYFTAL